MPSVSTFDPEPSLRNKRSRTRKREDEGDRRRPSVDAFERIVVLCSVRDRSRTELEARLIREGYDLDESAQALERAQNCGLIDDMRFADALIRARVFAGKGPKVVRRDLLTHGILAEEVPGWPYEYGLDDESCKERALAYLQTQHPRGRNPYACACRKLESRGYTASVISYVAHAWLETQAQSNTLSE